MFQLTFKYQITCLWCRAWRPPRQRPDCRSRSRHRDSTYTRSPSGCTGVLCSLARNCTAARYSWHSAGRVCTCRRCGTWSRPPGQAPCTRLGHRTELAWTGQLWGRGSLLGWTLLICSEWPVSCLRSACACAELEIEI